VTAGIATLDAAPAAAFVAAMAPLFEGAPGFLWRLAAARGEPFRSWARLFARARTLAHQLPEPLQVELVEAHPRLGAAREGLSVMSAREQGSAPPDAEAARLERLNADYEARFGFRYCVFVAGRPLASLVPELEASLALDPAAHRASELHRALDAVVDIARARHEASQGRPAGARDGRRTS
jgi:2-oxo-4-hydroxy-4-carboxy-5-ureidoimidazoline decarboxylase